MIPHRNPNGWFEDMVDSTLSSRAKEINPGIFAANTFVTGLSLRIDAVFRRLK